MRLNLAKIWRFVRRSRSRTTSELHLSASLSISPNPTVCPGLGSYNKQPTDPLDVLPPELVGDIFYLWLLDSVHRNTKHWSSQFPVLICLVSKSWRDFVYASPLLWTHVRVEASQGGVPMIHALQKRLRRSQNAPLFVDIMLGKRPDKDVLKVIFAEGRRFRHLTLRAFDVSLRDNIPTRAFGQLSDLTVHVGWGYHRPNHMEELSSIFSSAPHLRSVNWSWICDPGPIEVNGSQLHFLDLNIFHVPVTRVLEVLTLCPNLRNAGIRLRGEFDIIPTPPTQRILLPELRSLVLDGTKHLAYILRSIQTPLLSRLQVRWCDYDVQVGEDDFEALRSFLVHCRHLEDIALRRFLGTEDDLINIIADNNNLVTLTVAATPHRTGLITHRSFEFLTRQGQGNCTLPRLEKLVFLNALDVSDEVVLRMIESRTFPSNDMECSSDSRRPRALKSIRMDGCKPMAVETIARLRTICQESGLKAEGALVHRNCHSRVYFE
ncbi:hypothetical protein PAXRUDRAFT_827038 [Paxillus rubicundulus Ve08.2h10]|uniref:F-box domain-containing protein n=1 Tax=Paxillus rubicundulus Ve08.2h10 TaxID=930991 RepID=A0A0D0DR98_9AGAM|nr:hypothetical protein PAXRUDRAFT_827038 [Paxillus rubicundulus Ve08.2h10]